jgi:mycoredoxin-dependent peroxiredoxin
VSVEIGQRAPEFALKNQHGQLVRLSQWQGRRNVLLVFYPLAFSGVCTGELAALQRELPFFAEHETDVVAASVDSMYAQRAFADQQGLDFPLLADFWPHGDTARAYGVFDEQRGVALRGSFLVDTAGAVRWTVVHAIPDARDMEEYMKAVAAL